MTSVKPVGISSPRFGMDPAIIDWKKKQEEERIRREEQQRPRVEIHREPPPPAEKKKEDTPPRGVVKIDISSGNVTQDEKPKGNNVRRGVETLYMLA